MRIAVLGFGIGPNSHYRALNPAKELARRGHHVTYTDSRRHALAELRGFDAVLVYRDCSPTMQQLGRSLGDLGVAVVYDNDDQPWDLHPSHPDYKRFGGLHGKRLRNEMMRMVRVAHVVTTPSAALAEQYEEAGGTVRIVENHVPDEFVTVSRRPHVGIVVGWTAAVEHQIDRDMLDLTSTFERLLEAHAQLRVTTIGIRLGTTHERYRHVGYVEFPQLARELAALDVGIAPIADIATNRARSSCKVKEYAAVGVPWLASPVGPYAGLGERQGGRLVADDEWYEAIEQLVLRPRERRELGAQAAQWAREETIARNADQWDAVLETAVERARAAVR